MFELRKGAKQPQYNSSFMNKKKTSNSWSRE